MKKINLPLIFFLISSCATKPQSTPCTEATEVVKISKAQAKKIEGKVSQFLSDARITQEHTSDGQASIWRFTNMPSDSVYYKVGLREGDGIYKTNLGPQTNSINLISDLSGIPSGTTNCLYVLGKDKTERVIQIELEDK